MTREFDVGASVLWIDKNTGRRPCTIDYFLCQTLLLRWAVIRGGRNAAGTQFIVFELPSGTQIKILFKDTFTGNSLFSEAIKSKRADVALQSWQRKTLDARARNLDQYFESPDADAQIILDNINAQPNATPISIAELWFWLGEYMSKPGHGPKISLAPPSIVSIPQSGAGSKLDPLTDQIIDRLTNLDLSLSQCCVWLKESHGITITRQGLQQWAINQNVKRPVRATKIEIYGEQILKWFKEDQRLTVNAVKLRIHAAHGVQLNTTQLTKWVRAHGITPYTQPSYVAALDEVWTELMSEVSRGSLSPREAAAWLRDKKDINVPISAITQRIQKKGIRISYVFTRKRESVLDPLKEELTALFADQNFKISHGIEWLKSKHEIHLIPLTLANWLRANKIRIPVSRPVNKGVREKLRENKEAIFTKFRRDSVTVSEATAWIASEYGVTVSTQTLSAFLRDNGSSPKQLRRSAAVKNN